MKRKGFTLIELLIVVAILAVLIGATIVALNPFENLGQANNATRWAGITTIMNAIYQNVIDNGGTFATSTDGCPIAGIPTSATVIATSTFDLCACVASGTTDYIGMMPVDPVTGVQAPDLTDPCTNYDTRYEIVQNSVTGRITITAPDADLDESISITR